MAENNLKNGVLLIPFDNEGKFLLQHRPNDAPNFPGFWSFFGGVIENGETPQQAIRREVKEDLNYDLPEPELWLTMDYGEIKKVKKYYFLDFCQDKTSLILREGQGMKWVTFEEAKKLEVVEHDRVVIDKLKKFISKHQTENKKNL